MLRRTFTSSIRSYHVASTRPSLIPMKAIRQAIHPNPKPLSSTRILSPQNHGRLNPIHSRLLSTETRAAIDKAVSTSPVVLFMKGTPETPQCGFSRASIQILGLQGVDPGKFTAFNVLEDEELRQGAFMKIGMFWKARIVYDGERKAPRRGS